MRPLLKKMLLRLFDLIGFNALLGLLLTRDAYLVGYHSITSPEGQKTLESWRYPHVAISAETFTAQLGYLQRHGHTFVALSEFHDALKKGIRKPTIIYFDDGYKDTLLTALPILHRRSIPVAVFLVGDLLSSTKKTLPGFIESEKPGFTPFLDWEGARELVRQGATIGSHTVSHSKLVYCNDEQLEHELQMSKKMLEEKLGISVDAISYPHGRADARVAQAAQRAGYRWGLTTAEGLNSLKSIEKSPFLLRKVEPRPEDTFSQFRTKVYSAGFLAQLRGR